MRNFPDKGGQLQPNNYIDILDTISMNHWFYLFLPLLVLPLEVNASGCSARVSGMLGDLTSTQDAAGSSCMQAPSSASRRLGALVLLWPPSFEEVV